MSGLVDCDLAAVCGANLIEFSLYYANERISIARGRQFGSCHTHIESRFFCVLVVVNQR